MFFQIKQFKKKSKTKTILKKCYFIFLFSNSLLEDFMKMVSTQNFRKSNEKFINNQSFLTKLKQNHHNPFNKQSLSQSPKNEEGFPSKLSLNSTSPKSSPKRPSIFSLKNSEDIFKKLKLPQSDLAKLNEDNIMNFDRLSSIDVEKQVNS